MQKWINEKCANRKNCLCVLSENTFCWSLVHFANSFLDVTLCYQQPIPVENLLVEDLSDGDAKPSGWFIQDRDIKTRYRWIEYSLHNLIVLLVGKTAPFTPPPPPELIYALPSVCDINICKDINHLSGNAVFSNYLNKRRKKHDTIQRSINLKVRNNVGKLAVPLPRTNYLKNSFSYQGAVLWNSLPPDLRQAQTLNGFRIGCRHHFS